MTKKTALQLKALLIVLLLWAALSATMIVTMASTLGWFLLGTAVGMIMALQIFVSSRKKTSALDPAKANKARIRRMKQAAVVTIFAIVAGAALMVATPSSLVGWWILGVGVGLIAVLHMFYKARTAEPKTEGQNTGTSKTEGQQGAKVA